MLGQNVNHSIYTQNWIAFEVGLACAMDKQVWVFEQKGSSVNFPIPYVTDYVLYNNLENNVAFDYVRAIIEGYGDKTFFHRTDIPEVEIPKGKFTKCPNCNSIFNFHHVDNSLLRYTRILFICPLCRQEIKQ